VGAAVLLGLALVPELPSWPFAAIALGCALAALASRRQRAADAVRLTVPQPLVLALGSELAARLLTRGSPTRALATALDAASAGVTQTLGVSLPAAHVHADAQLPSRAMRWSWRELPQPIRQVPLQTDLAHAVGQTLTQLGLRQAADCLSLDQVQHMVDQLEREQPALVRLTMPRPLSPLLLAEVLRLLVREGVSVRWLSEIVEAIAPHAGPAARACDLVEHARRALALRISHTLATQGSLHVLRLSPEVEEALSDALRKQPEGDVLALNPDLAQEIAEAVHHAHRAAPVPHALVTQADLRRHVRGLIAENTPDLYVVSAYELMPYLKLSLGEPIGP